MTIRSGLMVRTKRRREVTIELDEVVIRHAPSVTLAWCEACSNQVQMLTPEQAAAATTMSVRAIYQRVEARVLHFKETEDGSLLICINSLSL